jgi:hypothetical protein
LLRGFWMVIGNAALALLLIVMVQGDWGVFSLPSIAFWMFVGLVVGARYLDVTRYKGTTSDGDRPATLIDVKRFSIQQLVVSGAAWGLVQVL